MFTIDLHCHPGLKSWLFNKNFEIDHTTHSKDFFPTDMAVDYPKMVEGNVDAVFASVYLPESQLIKEVNPSHFIMNILKKVINHEIKFENNETADKPFEQTIDFLNHFENNIDNARRNGCKVVIAKNLAEMKNRLNENYKIILHSIEGAHSLGSKVNGKEPNYIDNLLTLFNKGVCLLTLAHFYENDIVSPTIGMPPSILDLLNLAKEKDLSKGLSDVGKEVVEKMLDIGMLVDMTHSTPKARTEIFELNDNRGDKRRPLVFSHVGVANKFNHAMNPTDEEILKIKECNGTIGLIFYNYYLMGKEENNFLFPIIDFKPDPGIQYILYTIDHIYQVTGGYDNISIGSDLDGFTDPCDDLYNTGCFKYLRFILTKKYGDSITAKILGGNIMRVLELGWGK